MPTAVVRFVCVLAVLAGASAAFGADPKIEHPSFVDLQGKRIAAAQAGQEVFVDLWLVGVPRDAVDRVYAQFSVFRVALQPVPPPPPGTPAAAIQPVCEAAPMAAAEEHQVYPQGDEGGFAQVISVKPAAVASMQSGLRVRIPLTVDSSVATCAMPTKQVRKLTFVGLRVSSRLWTGDKAVKAKGSVSIPVS